MKIRTALMCTALGVAVVGVSIRGVAAEDAGTTLTVFSGGTSQVDEMRALGSAAGTLSLEGVSPQIQADTVRLTQWGGALNVRSIRLSREVLSRQALLKRYVGKTIGIVKTHPTTGAETVVDADVLSLQSGGIFRVAGRIEVGAPGRLVFPDETFGLPARPALVASITGGDPSKPLGLSYLTGGFSWAPAYTATLNAAGDRLELTARAAVTNGTDQDMSVSRLNLVAGDVRTEGPKLMAVPMAEAAAAGAMLARSAPQADIPQRQTFGAFHLYQVPGGHSLAAGETVQVTLLETQSLPVSETLISRGRPPVFGPMATPDTPSHPEVRLSVTNPALDAGGQPWPAGLLRAYRSKAQGTPLFTGEARLGDTPPGEEAKLTLGRAFDVTVRRTQTDFARLDQRGRNVEAAFDVLVKNGRDKAAEVELREAIPGDWQVLNATQEVTREGGEAVWQLTIPANGETSLSYRVRVLR